uniref:LsmAD domain-containing protein n=1 Tax=Anisakis simplex TaxID=6269 RepID=A0A0M3JIM6_ANISI
LGVSVNKKDASTNAARDFSHFLIRQKLLDPSEMPSLTAESLEATTVKMSADGWGSGSAAGDDGSLLKSEGVDYAEGNIATSPYIPPQKPKTEHEKYIEQRAQEVAQVD